MYQFWFIFLEKKAYFDTHINNFCDLIKREGKQKEVTIILQRLMPDAVDFVLMYLQSLLALGFIYLTSQFTYLSCFTFFLSLDEELAGIISEVLLVPKD